MKDINVKNVKMYLLEEALQQEDIDAISGCIRRNQLKKYVEKREYFFYKSLSRLHESQSFVSLDYHLTMMNELFDNKKFDQVKAKIFKELLHHKINLSVFKVMVACRQMPDLVLIEYLHETHKCDSLMAARFALYVDEPYEATQYLKLLSDCDDEVVLRLLCGFSKAYYLELMAHYKFKKGSSLLKLANA